VSRIPREISSSDERRAVQRAPQSARNYWQKSKIEERTIEEKPRAGIDDDDDDDEDDRGGENAAIVLSKSRDG